MGQPNWFVDILRMLFRYIDAVAYWLVDMVYQLFMKISEIGVFSPETISQFAGRIYALLGIFMLFKVSFSLITYILNPDSLTDKNKGMGKLLTNFFVVLIGIVAVPYVFQAAYRLQAIILEENVIGNLIMGINSNQSEEEGESYIEEGGKRMAFTTLSAFIRLNTALVDEECSYNPIVAKENGTLDLSQACYNNSKSNALEVTANNGQTVRELLIEAYTNNSTSLYINTDLVTLKAVNSSGTQYYIMDYTILISTVAGAFLAWILLLFCIDIATRSVKLGFLQLIAPIPIISYVDPKGKDLFNKWLKECGKTYADLFIRLIAIYFVIFIISELTRGGFYSVVSNELQQVKSLGDVLVNVFIIFGALMFAKQLPDLISNILGVKLSGGGFTLNPMKKLGASPYAAGLAGAVGGALGGGIANAWAAHRNGDGFLKGLGSTIAGAGSAGFRGAKAGLTSGGKGSLFAGAATGIRASSQARNLRDKKYNIRDKVNDRVADLAGIKFSTGTTSDLKNRTNLLQQQLANSRRNEQAMSTALNQRISESGAMTAGLLRTFDGDVTTGADGNTMYVKKTYESYLENVARMHASSSGVNYDTLDDSAREAIKTNVVTIGKAASESDFNSLNELYEARNNEDLTGRALEKEINDIHDDMGKFKDRNKR